MNNYTELITNHRIKFIIIIFTGIIILSIAIQLLMTGFVFIRTDNDVAITILKKGDDESKTVSGTKSLDFIGSAGDYIITASKYNQKQRQEIYIGPWPQFLNYNFTDMSDNISPDPIAPINAQDIRLLPNNTLRYYNALDSTTYDLVDKEAPRLVENLDQNLSNIKWADGKNGTGIGRRQDNDNIYLTDGIKSTLLALPNYSSSTISEIQYAIGSNGDIFISDNHHVYHTQDMGKTYKSIYKTRSTYVNILPMEDNHLLVVDDSETQSDTDEDPMVDLLSIDGKGSIKKRKNGIFIQQIDISPDGKSIAIAMPNETLILNSSLNTILSLPEQFIIDTDWIDSNTLIYTTDRDAWAVDVRTKVSKTILHLPFGKTITNTQIIGDNLYISSKLGNDMYYLSKINYRNPYNIPTYKSAIESQLPTIFDDCLISYNIMTTPTIYYTPISNSVSTESCRESTKVFMSRNNFSDNIFFVTPSSNLTSNDDYF